MRPDDTRVPPREDHGTWTVLRDLRRAQSEPSLGPALLALLPLRRLAAATLRECPVLLRRDEVVLPALHLELDPFGQHCEGSYAFLIPNL